MVENPIQKQLQRLARLRGGTHPIVSCYLKLEPRDRGRGKYLVKLKNRIRSLKRNLEQLHLSDAQHADVLADLQRIQAAIADPATLPAGQGVAIFASTGRGLLEVLGLPRVHRSRLVVDRTPLIRELVTIEEEVGRMLTAVVDRQRAEIFEVSAWGANRIETITATTTRTGRSRTRGSVQTLGGDRAHRGRGDAGHRNRIQQDKQRHLEEVARRIFELDRKHPFQGVVAAGTGPEAQALQPFLHPYLVDRYIGSVTLNAKEHSAVTIHGATLAIREAHERASEQDLVDEVIEGLGTQWAVSGLASTLRALGRGQIRTLLVDAEASQTGLRDATGRLGVRKADLRGGGKVTPVLDVIDDALEEALHQGVQVNVIVDPASRARFEGLAGMLRFR